MKKIHRRRFLEAAASTCALYAVPAPALLASPKPNEEVRTSFWDSETKAASTLWS